ncbi:hypothetical protein WA026_014597 [Henosepilachna vigintioctopunctata]|uniref:Uncharacterized protein n=1 Tax=Henosepilachna vigintioctopunctata TaxID=420089 RepID=A0AAW1V6M8_9CUCU
MPRQKNIMMEMKLGKQSNQIICFRPVIESMSVQVSTDDPSADVSSGVGVTTIDPCVSNAQQQKIMNDLILIDTNSREPDQIMKDSETFNKKSDWTLVKSKRNSKLEKPVTNVKSADSDRPKSTQRGSKMPMMPIIGYRIVASYCRPSRRHGGSAIYLSNDYEFLPISAIDNISIEMHCEISGVLVKTIDHKVCVLSVYRPPTGDIDKCLLLSCDELSSKMAKNSDIHYYRAITNEKLDYLRVLVQNADFGFIYLCTDINISFSEFMVILRSLVDKSCPMRSGPSSVTSNNWITPEVIRAAAELKNLHWLYVNLRSEGTLRMYRSAKSNYRKFLNTSKSNFYQEKLIASDNKSKTLWSLVNKEIGHAKRSTNAISLNIDGRKLSDPEVADSQLATVLTGKRRVVNKRRSCAPRSLDFSGFASIVSRVQGNKYRSFSDFGVKTFKPDLAVLFTSCAVAGFQAVER